MTRHHAYVETYGCAANKFDFEIILAHLAQAGYDVTPDVAQADLLLVNTCGVKQPTEDRVLARLRRLGALEKPLIVTGCLPKINREAVHAAVPDFAAMLDPQSLDLIPAAIDAAVTGARRQVFQAETPCLKLSQPKIRLNPVIEILAIAEGCVGACAYCCVKFARGALRSAPKELIVDRVRRAVTDGVKEVWLTAQDTGAYGQDTGTTLVDLLQACCHVEGAFRLRVGMMNPHHAIPLLPELIDAYKREKVFKFLHLPVQSGDDRVLHRMNRHHSVQDFLDSVAAVRQEIPEVTLATDVICGFPGESLDAFERTLRLLEAVQPDIVHVSKFFPRPHTIAAHMAPLDARMVKTRSRRLTQLVTAIAWQRNRQWRSWVGDVLIDEPGRGASWIGRNFAYKPIVVHTPAPMLGTVPRVRVVNTFPTYLQGEVVEAPSEAPHPIPRPR